MHSAGQLNHMGLTECFLNLFSKLKNWMKKRLPADLNWIILEAASTCHSKYFFKGAEDVSCGLLSKFDIPHSKTAIEVKNSLVFLLNAALSSENHVYKMVRNFVTVIFSFQEERKKSRECHLYSFTYFFLLI